MIAVAIGLVLAAAECGADEPVAQGTASLRQRVLAMFDADGNGRLDAQERELLRKSGKFGPQRRGAARRGAAKRRQQFGPNSLKKYDQDQDGKLDDKEYEAAQRGLRAKWEELVQTYSAYKDDRPVVGQLNKMEADAKTGKIKDFPEELFGWISFVRSRAGRGRPKSRAHALAQFDTDKDGTLNARELKQARAALVSKHKADKNGPTDNPPKKRQTRPQKNNRN